MTRQGYTLIELLIVFSIIGILLGIGIVAYNDFNKRQTLKGAALNLKNDLRAAQNKALAGEKASCGTLDGYQVSFSNPSPNNGRYTIAAACAGGTFGPSTSIDFPNGVTFSSPPSPVVFKVLGQGVRSDQSIYLYGFDKCYKLSVTTSGEIKDEGFTACL